MKKKIATGIFATAVIAVIVSIVKTVKKEKSPDV